MPEAESWVVTFRLSRSGTTWLAMEVQADRFATVAQVLDSVVGALGLTAREAMSKAAQAWVSDNIDETAGMVADRP